MPTLPPHTPPLGSAARKPRALLGTLLVTVYLELDSKAVRAIAAWLENKQLRDAGVDALGLLTF